MLRAPITPAQWLRIIVVAGAALRLFPIWFGLPYPHARPDEAVSVSRAMDILAGDLNPHFFHWPSFTFYLFAALFGVVRIVRRLLFMDPTFSTATAMILGRACVAVAGTATIAVLFTLGRRALDTATGLLAAAFLSVAMLHVRDSHFAMTDVLMTLLVTASLTVLLRAFDAARAARHSREVSIARFAVAGVLGGLAASTKYSAVAIVAAMAAAHLVLLVRWREMPWSPRSWLPSLAFLGAFAVGFLIATPYAALDFATFSADLRFDFAHLAEGHGLYLGPGWQYHATRSLPYGSGVVIFAMALAGLPIFVWRRPEHAAVIGAFVAVFYAGIGRGHTVFFRYVLPLVPIVCLFAAVAIRTAGAWIALRASVRERTAIAVLAALAGGPALVNAVWFDVLLARTDTRVLAGEWLAPRIRAGETIHDAGGDYARLQLGRTPFHEWSYDAEKHTFGHPQGLTPDWLVLTQSPLRMYASAPPALRLLANSSYDLVFTVRGTSGAAAAAVYDLQDAFFLPLAGFRTVERPGPTIMVYRRRN
jgi:4-amino-4-deoxy-L-arabinose transferase-like glycosyltransferase